jgi:hypothetical protein
MTDLTEGLNQTDFLAAINDNFAELAVIHSVSAYTTILSTDNYVNLINSNYGSNIVWAGMNGLQFKNALYNIFFNATGSFTTPSSPAITWINDFARITFTDHTNGTAPHEIWESKNGGSYTLAHTLAAGITTYDYYTWQNANLNFKIRAHDNLVYSGYSTVVNIATPLVFKTDQSNLNDTVNNPFKMKYFWVLDGYSITMNFGDGTSLVFNQNSIYSPDPNINKTYTVAGQYFIIMSGDTDKITALFDTTGGLGRIYGNITKWIFPTSSVLFHIYGSDFTGTDFTEQLKSLPVNLGILNISGCHISGVFGNDFTWPAGVYDIHLDGCNFTGNPFINGVPVAVRNITCSGNTLMSGDLSTFIPTPITNTYLSAISYDSCNFTGDLSGQSIAIGTTAIGVNISASGCKFTKGYRGHFLNVNGYNFENNLFNSAEIDSILAYVDTYFTGGVVPMMNCIYKLNNTVGTSMGTPSAAGLASRTSILGKYTTAGFTATIAVNS